MSLTARAHIALVLPVLDPGGAEGIVAELARRLPAHGFQTSVICLEGSHTALGEALERDGIAVTGLKLSRRNTLKCAAALRRSLPQARPLILHAHLFHANLAARLAFAKLPVSGREGVRVLSTVHVAERRFRPWQFTLDRLTARWCRAEVCVSQAVKRFQCARTGLPEDYFRVVENGIDLGRFTRIAESSGRDARGTDAPCVVSVGRLDPQKDYPTLLRAWRGVLAQFPRARLKIAGDGPERAALEALARALSLGGSVEFRGRVAEIPEFLRQADLYFQSSAWEGFGLAVAEAMASALPVVVTAADSLPELVAHRRTGLVVPVGDDVALTGAMLELLRDRKSALRLGQAAREEAQARFSAARMVEACARLYREVLDGSGSGFGVPGSGKVFKK